MMKKNNKLKLSLAGLMLISGLNLNAAVSNDKFFNDISSLINKRFQIINQEFFNETNNDFFNKISKLIDKRLSNLQNSVINYKDKISEDKNYIYYKFYLPGFNKKDITIYQKKNSIYIKALKKKKNMLKEFNYDFNQPKNIVDISTTFKNNILELKFKKKQNLKNELKKIIPIN
jgi:HSP20 family molecular chaperone IbpA